ncbi:MAG: MFS transporter [Actinomycetota bacterium]|nr:MFS transporter [Actinomycetota bacterium]
MASPTARPPASAWVVWGVGVTAYVVAVLHRTSLGVSGIEASERFAASASELAGFAVLQLLVYAALQVPVGVMLDRVGARRLVLTGAAVMAGGQLLLALTTDLAVAVGARVLVGAGDAMTFISVLRLVSAWFPPRRAPLMTQLTGIAGQLGQVLSAVPFVALLHGGWTRAYASAAALGVLVTVLAAAVLRDAPPGTSSPGTSSSVREVGRQLLAAWRHPGTRLGLTSHFTTQFSGTVFALLWGYPFLVSAQGLSAAAASTLLTLFVVAGMAAAPVVGVLVARHPLRRSWLVLGITGLTVALWSAVLALSEPAPTWLLVALVLVLALGGPGSMIAFDFARTFNPPNRLGTATGIVNVGGFVASLVTMLLVGVVLDLRTPQGAPAYGLEAFRLALSVQFLVWGVGVVGVLRTRAAARRRLAEDHGVVVPPIREALARRRRARRARTPSR